MKFLSVLVVCIKQLVNCLTNIEELNLKIRTGFVSNSSSSSFIVMKPASGEDLTKEEVYDKVKDLFVKGYREDYVKENPSDVENLSNFMFSNSEDKGQFELIFVDIDNNAYEDIEALLIELGIPFYCGDY